MKLRYSVSSLERVRQIARKVPGQIIWKLTILGREKIWDAHVDASVRRRLPILAECGVFLARKFIALSRVCMRDIDTRMSIIAPHS
jgi:hypothetical protein